MPGAIYINYRCGEDRWSATGLVQHLQESFDPDQLSMDTDTIRAGARFVSRVEDPINKCEVFLVLIGPHWLDARDESGERRLDQPDDLVRFEIETALRLGKRIVPVLVDRAVMPSAEQLPQPLQPIARYMAAKLNHESFASDMKNLIMVLQEALEEACQAKSAVRQDTTADFSAERLTVQLEKGDVAESPCDVLFLKHADGFHGADAYVAGRIGFNESLNENEWTFWPGRGLGATRVLFGGVGPLVLFRYEAIRAFAQAALRQIGKNYPDARSVASTIHGVGYGLDEKEAFLALLAGLLDGTTDAANVKAISIVDRDARRVARLQQLLGETLPTSARKPKTAEVIRPDFSSVGKESEQKPRLFVAMPFGDDFIDEFEIAFMEASDSNGFLCERADLAIFAGDVMDWVRQRIETSCGLIALMNSSNPNVFLEIGYAWAKGIPTILVLRKGHNAPFNVKGQRVVEYESIHALRKKLTAEISSLKTQGILMQSRLA